MNRPDAFPFELAAELGARLSREPFLPFAVETTDGVLLHVGARWQAIASATQFIFGEPSNGTPGCVAEATFIPLDQVARIVDAQNAPVAAGGEGTPIAAVPGVLRLFTDGACQGNPGPGGWGFIVKDDAGHELGRCSGGERPTTNNRMELTSVIRGLEMLDPAQSVRLITDSQYVAKGLSEWMAGWKRRGWKRKTAKGLEPVANEDLWRRLDELTATKRVVCEWVRGHAGHPENEECDRMAVEAAANV